MKIGSFELDLNALAAVITAAGALIMAIRALIMATNKKKKDDVK